MRWKFALAAVLALVLIGVASPTAPSQTTPSVSQRVYHYGAGPTTQTDVPCGSATRAVVVYVEVHARGPWRGAVTNGVRLNDTLLWQQEGPGINVLTAMRAARYYQLLTSSGVWTFEAQATQGGTLERCTVTKL